jgi:hypothetical protein
MKANLALLLLLLVLPGQTFAQTRKVVHSKPKAKKVAPQHGYISSYMRQVALLYLEETDKLHRAHAAKDFDTADTYERTIKQLEQSISIELDSDPCAVTCSSTKAFLAAHTNQSFFNVLQSTESLADVMSLNLGYDGSDNWQVSSPDKLTDLDRTVMKQYFSCKAVVDTAIKTGALILNEDCVPK